MALMLQPPCPEIAVPAGTTVIKCVPVRDGGAWYYVYMLRIEYAPALPTYAIWIPPGDGGSKPAVLMTNPYDIVAWDGDDPLSLADVRSCSDYVEAGSVFLINGFGVLHAFGRFHTGGNLQNEVDDMTAGLRFLGDSGFADAGRLGIWGGSWGGFESLYGAANAPEGATPIAGVAFFPPVDFNDFENYVTAQLPAQITEQSKEDWYVDFYSKYLTRIYETENWETWTTAALAAKLTTPFLVLHDEWDALVPVSQSVNLVNASSLVEPVWFYQDTAVDLNALPITWGHGELRKYQLDSEPPPAFAYGMGDTLAAAYLIRKLSDPGQAIVIGYDADALVDFIAYMRDYTCMHGRDTSWLRARLLDLVDERVLMVELNTRDVSYGSEAIAEGFSNCGWGGSAYGAAAAVRISLETSGLPDCP